MIFFKFLMQWLLAKIDIAFFNKYDNIIIIRKDKEEKEFYNKNGLHLTAISSSTYPSFNEIYFFNQKYPIVYFNKQLHTNDILKIKQIKNSTFFTTKKIKRLDKRDSF